MWDDGVADIRMTPLGMPILCSCCEARRGCYTPTGLLMVVTAWAHGSVCVWRCLGCGFESFPRRLKEADARSPFKCRNCGSELHYDEEE